MPAPTITEPSVIVLSIDSLSTAEVEATIAIHVPGLAPVESAEVTLYANHGRSTVRRQHPFDTCGTPLDVWASDPIVALAATLVSEGTTDEDERTGEGEDTWRGVMGLIEHEVDCAARAEL
jgi:hypothetical protein